LQNSSFMHAVNGGGSVTAKKAILWHREVDNSPRMLASVLQPLSEAGADLQVVMAYRYPGSENKAAMELYPISDRRSAKAAQTTGLAPSSISILVVEGDNRPGSATRSPKRSAMRGST
jgi:hypothetical protein